MTFLQALILGIIQGITEFLPVSSSGHLVIIPFLLDWDLPADQVFPFDVLIQIATLIAVIVYYWKDLFQIGRSMAFGIKNKKPFEEIKARTGWLTLIATIPAGFAGLLFIDYIEDAFHSPTFAGALLIGTAAIISVSEKISKKNRNITTLNWLDAVVMGITQALSIFPGISRSGSTISGGLFRHLDRKTAGQFAFLMAIPIMTAAGLLGVFDLIKIPNLIQFLPILAVGFITAGIIGFVTIRWLLGYITNHSLLPFALYCLILGSGTLALAAVNPATPDYEEIKSGKNSYRISYSASVQWMFPTINDCSRNIPESSFFITRSDNDTLASSDMHISYGELFSAQPYIYKLGNDSLVPSVLKNNPINNLTLNALQGMYQGNISTFKDLAEECSECNVTSEGDINLEEAIHWWVYPEDSYLYKEILSTFKLSAFNPNLSIAPNLPGIMQALSLDARAIGFLPQRAINDSLKSISIIDISNDQYLMPITASIHTEPDEVLADLLVCLQERIMD